MGGCATKPKVLKGDEGDVPSKKEAVPVAKETVAADQGENKVEADKVVENNDVNDVNIDDQSNKRSISNLFEEKENKGTAESDNTQSEAEPMKKDTVESVPQESPDIVKQGLESVTKNQETVESVPQELPDLVKQVVEPVTMNQETKEPEKPVEPVSVPPVNTESEKLNEAKPAPTVAVVNVPETQNRETSSGETKDQTVVAN